MSFVNPVFGLAAMRRIEALPADSRDALASVLREIGLEAEAKADYSWKKHKGPMAAYWKAVAVYARHIARAVEKLNKGETP